MPFVQRIVEPKFVSRLALFNDDGTPKVADEELQAVTNSTLCNALRQLASLALVADDIFKELGGQLKIIYQRSENVRTKIATVEGKVNKYDPKKVPVPEGDICSFAQTKEHYAAKHPMDTNLFGVASRTDALKALYEAASKTPVHVMRQLDRWRRDGHRSSKFFVCTPVLGAKRRKIKSRVDIEIETRMPDTVNDLRRWTSDEAFGDVTVGPSCVSRITNGALSDGEATDGTIVSDDEGVDHKLPSPEEQLQVVALRFPAEIVAVDVSGRSFDRMSLQRRSLMNGEIGNRTTDGDTVKRKGRTRKPRSRRRNTLAGTDQKEIQDALTAGTDPSSPTTSNHRETAGKTATVPRSKSSDVLRSCKRESIEVKKSHFNTLKQWGKTQYDKLMNKSSERSDATNAASKTNSEDGVDDFNLYETIASRRKRNLEKERKTHERNSSISSSEKSLPANGNTLTAMMNIAVKLRDSSLQRRQRRTGTNKEEIHSSSGNWSASSESGRTSIGSEITSTTTQPKSTTSAATSNNSLNVPQGQPGSVNSRRRFNFNVSTSGSVTSEGTLTPDIIHDLHEDGDSVYSCDTEGYYTSFHMDSGLKTLKEEELPSSPVQSTSAISNNTAENEYELFGKGSTSTTTSSAGTVCTTLRASESNKSLVIGPAVPERKSSLSKLSKSSSEKDFGTIKRSPNTTTAAKKSTDGDVSPDSGHNTSSSPIESVSSPNGLRSGSDFEFSESSDMEGAERIERIRIKTTINSSRIPSMCVITPSHSDDESSSNSSYKKQTIINNLKNSLEKVDPDKFDTRIISTNVNGTNRLALVSVDVKSGYATVENIDRPDAQTATVKATIRAPSPSGGTVTVKEECAKTVTQPVIKSSLMPLNNMFGKLRTNLASLAGKRDRSKSPKAAAVDEGEYVTIADVRNNNKEVTYSNDSINRNLNTVLSGKMRDAEYVSLDELPVNENNNVTCGGGADSLERKQRQGARVTLDAEGKVVYSSDSLRRRKGCHTTFEPGPFIKSGQSPVSSPSMPPRATANVRPVSKVEQSGKVVIRASGGNQTEIVRTPTAVVGPGSPKGRALSPKGAYVHVQAAGAVAASPKEAREGASHQDRPHHHPPNTSLGTYLPNRTPDMYRYAEDQCQYPTAHQYYQGRALYSTLPGKRSQFFGYEIPPERSVTPDITRGLDKDTRPLTRQMVFRSDQNLISLGEKVGIPHPQEFYSPKLGYRDLESQGEEDSFKISPIDPVRSTGGLKSSTPSQLKAATKLNLDHKVMSPKKSTMSNEELYAVIHKTKKKLNIDDQPHRASPVTVGESTAPKKPAVETGYIGSRLSWSPSRGEYIDLNPDTDKISPPNESGSRQSCKDRKSPKKTSTLDFKRLLLSKTSSLSANKKVSAVEQLKLSKQKMEQKPQPTSPGNVKDMTILDLSSSPRSLLNRRLLNNPPGSPDKASIKPTAKILSPRSQWRFANPRSDVLSSTIMEDCREDESSGNSSTSMEKKKGNATRISQAEESTNSPLSISQRLSAQRAEFFGNTASDGNVKKVPPTLETAF